MDSDALAIYSADIHDWQGQLIECARHFLHSEEMLMCERVVER